MNLLSARALRCALLASGMIFGAATASAQRPAKVAKAAPGAPSASVYRVSAHQRPDNSWGFSVYKNNVIVHSQDKVEGLRKGYADKAAAEAAAGAYVTRLKSEEKH
ncbi:hypothetical protein [Flaviaesturariibacter amylovorans]|uniref:DUF4148 domain-containing protein n=1 Tax=Flaviaesturariibacter amylovorans TaxID=1084520 RepID=A0ABP8HJS7_9BACT